MSVHIGDTMLTESIEEKLLGVTLDKNLDFKSHVNAICKKAGQKLHAHAQGMVLKVHVFLDLGYAMPCHLL